MRKKENPEPSANGTGWRRQAENQNNLCPRSTQAQPALRDYQMRGVEEIRAAFGNGIGRVLYQAPTGSGKTVLFIFIAVNAAARGHRTLILVHRDELIGQVAAALDSAGIFYGIIGAGYLSRPLAPVQVANVATLTRRLFRYADAFDLVIVDECHHAIAPTWRRVIDAMPRAKILGVTATPARLDGRGLGAIFEHLILGPSVGELIATGFLSRFRVYLPARAPDMSRVRVRAGDYALEDLSSVMADERLTDDAIADYRRICPATRAVAFCVDVAHSKAVAARLRKSGLRAVHLDGGADRDERRRLVQDFGAGKIDILCNCALISEGFDVPAIGAAILLRPTKSLAFFLQQVGRALRPAPGKDRAIILDAAGNCMRHGLPDDPREWSLDGVGAERRSAAVRFIRCRHCGALNHLAALDCEACGEALRVPMPAAAPPPRQEHSELAAMNYYAALRWAGNSVTRLRMVAAARGYKPGWVFMRLDELRRSGALQ